MMESQVFLGLSLRGWCMVAFNLSGTLVLYRRLQNRASPLWRKLLGCAFVLLLLPLTLLRGLSFLPLLQFALRIFCLAGYLWAFKRGTAGSLLYCAWVGALSLLSAQNLIIGAGALLQQHRLAAAAAGGWPAPDAVSSLAVFAALFLLFLLMSAAVPFPELQNNPGAAGRQFLYVFLFSLMLLYIKDNMVGLFQIDVVLPAVVVIYPLLISLLALLYVIWGNKYYISRLEREEQRKILVENEYKYADLQHQLAAQEEVDRVYHDMKNHLIALTGLSDQKQKRYVEGILSQMETCQNRVSTGNQTLDGLLNGKQALLSQKQIRLEVLLDLSPLAFLAPVDVCSIFGNAMDNAVEASEKIPDPAQRVIRMKSSVYANQCVIVISNRCEAQLSVDEMGRLKTTKKDGKHHGIGLRSIQRSLDCYRGTMTCSVEQGIFYLKMLIPIRDSELE